MKVKKILRISDMSPSRKRFRHTPMTTRKFHYLLKFLFVLLIVPLSACSREHVAAPEHARQGESAVIVVPGYYGTRLIREADKRLVFISLSEALFGNQALTIPVPGLGFEGTIDLQPDSILDEVPVVPLFYSIDVYGSLLDRLRLSHNKGQEVIPFTYDWRGDLLEAVRSLDVLIRRLRDEGTHDISIVAHSMGGLIVSYYLRYGTQDIESAVENWKGAENVQRVVLAGVPFLGVMNSFRNMNFGVTVGWNSSLLSSEAYASFPASYYTLPVADTDELLTPELKSLSGVIRNAGQWRRSEWGLLKNKKTLSQDIVERRATYTAYWLERSQRFFDLIRTPLNTLNPHHLSLLYMYAKGTPTLAKGIWVGNQATGSNSLLFDDRNPPGASPADEVLTLYADGDGTVTLPSARLPDAFEHTFPTTIREYEVGHTELISDPGNQHDIVTFLDGR